MPYKNPQDKIKWSQENREKVNQYRMKWLSTVSGQQYLERQKAANERLKAEKKLAKANKAKKTEEELTQEKLLKKNKDKRYRQGLRLKAIELMGGRCSVCLIEDHDVLEFDHITPLLRKTSGIKSKGETAAHVIRDQDRDKNFQLLCANCHTKKTRFNKEFEYK
jgi:hypothetical protein